MIEILRKRRSVRKYKKQSINDSCLEILKEALLRSPSSRRIDPWVFIMIDQPDLLKRLAQAKVHGSEFLKNAALGIVVCGDEKKSDTWIEDCSIASIIVQLTAQSLGLGSCWIQIRNRPHSKDISAETYIQKILGIPEHLRVESIISLGIPAETPDPIPKEKLNDKKINYNHYD